VYLVETPTKFRQAEESVRTLKITYIDDAGL